MGRKLLILACLAAAGCGQGEQTTGDTENSDSSITSTSRLTVKLGYGFACVLDPGQGVYCWGANGGGQLGQAPSKLNGPAGLNASDVPVFVEGTEDALSLSVGDGHACVLTSTDVLCWGANGADQIGTSGAVDTCYNIVLDSDAGYMDMPCQPTPTSLGVGKQTWLSAGGEATCVGDGVVTTCRGSAAYRFSSMSDLTSISMSSDSVCGLTHAGKLKCDGSPSPDEYGVVQTLAPIESFVLGGGTNICAITVGGALQCWGDSNSSGELGAGHTEIVNPWETTTPVKLALKVAAGSGHFCALSNGGAVHCWGRNGDGQIGIPAPVFVGVEMTDPESFELPEGRCATGPCEPEIVLVDGIGIATSIAAGGESSCAVTEDRQVKCWGRLVGTSVPTVIVGPWSP